MAERPKSVADCLRAADVRAVSGTDLSELRTELFSRYDVGCELHGPLPAPAAIPLPSRATYNPHIKILERDDAVWVYAFRADRAVKAGPELLELLQFFRLPVPLGPLLETGDASIVASLQVLWDESILFDANADPYRIDWRGPRIIQHGDDMGARASFPPMELPEIELFRVMSRRLTPDYQFDQSLVSTLSVAGRVRAIQSHLRPNGHVLLVGDDDFLSVALAMKQIAVTVIDIDPRLLFGIEQLANEYDLAIDTIQGNVTRPLPPHLAGQFDAAVTDPIYESPAALDFARYATTSLRSGGLLFFSFASWMMVYREVYPRLLELDCELLRVYTRLNEYYSGTERGQTGPFGDFFQGPEDPDHIVPPPLFYGDFHVFQIKHPGEIGLVHTRNRR